ncbi:MAG: GTPase HflX [Brevinematales bacterium]|nr:GTPase HflX [Brevinematales bacterium]
MKCLVVYAIKDLKRMDQELLKSRLDEIKSLVKTLSWYIVDLLVINLRDVDPAFYITKGKVEEVKELRVLDQVEYIVFYNNLSPVHIRNLEIEFGKKVITKVDLILMIFKEHAVSLESKLQVELASLQVELPRLYGIGKEMEQIKGGIGLRGPGERKTEVMKRHIKERIRTLKKKIEDIKKHRKNQLSSRFGVFNVSIVGYTNSGKSSLMNLLTKANVLEENKLFSTLDTKTKRLVIEGVEMTITDTVGFIEDLPPQLVESFYSTLEVVKQSNLLIHLVDISSKFAEDKMRVVDEILSKIFREDKLELPKTLYVFNKVDLVENLDLINKFSESYPDALFISVKERINIKKLREQLRNHAEEYYKVLNSNYYLKTV